MIKNNFATVAVSEILKAGLYPDSTRPAPYLLVVDDEAVIADTLGAIFRNHGYAVAVTYDAESAIEVAELAPPELVITDFVLPRMNGVELAFCLQDSIPDCRICLISGQPEEAYGLAATMLRKEVRCFAKPVDPKELLNEAAKLLSSGNNNSGPQGVVLGGWKSIANYLQRGVRTVQRWETCFSLPVVRPAGRGRSAVCARTDELDAWLRQPRHPDALQQRIRELERQNEALKRQLAGAPAYEPLQKIA